MALRDSDRARLDAIVEQMIANDESDDFIRSVVNDFKTKYQPTEREREADRLRTAPDGDVEALKTGAMLAGGGAYLGGRALLAIPEAIQRRVKNIPFAEEAIGAAAGTGALLKRNAAKKAATTALSYGARAVAPLLAEKTAFLGATTPVLTTAAPAAVMGLGGGVGVLGLLAAAKGIQNERKRASILALSREGGRLDDWMDNPNDPLFRPDDSATVTAKAPGSRTLAERLWGMLGR